LDFMIREMYGMNEIAQQLANSKAK